MRGRNQLSTQWYGVYVIDVNSDVERGPISITSGIFPISVEVEYYQALIKYRKTLSGQLYVNSDGRAYKQETGWNNKPADSVHRNNTSMRIDHGKWSSS